MVEGIVRMEKNLEEDHHSRRYARMRWYLSGMRYALVIRGSQIQGCDPILCHLRLTEA